MNSFMFVANVVILLFCGLLPVDSTIEFEKVIHNGLDAGPGQFPYHVSVRENGGHRCGGAIINNYHVVTAAHCVSQSNPNDVSIYAGSVESRSGGVEVRVREIRLHPSYKWPDYDMAILVLRDYLQFTDNIKGVKIGSHELRSGTPVYATGWGGMAPGQTSTKLQYITLHALTYEECDERLPGKLPVSILCLDSPSGLGMCQGDSGGPGVFDGYLYGIFSYTVGGCGSSYPDGFAKVRTAYDWFLENTGETRGRW